MLLLAAQILQKPYKAQTLELLQHVMVMLIASSDIHKSHCAAHTWYVSRRFFLITAFQNNNTFT